MVGPFYRATGLYFAKIGGTPEVFTRRIFDGVLITILAAHVAFGLPRMWARKELAAGQSPAKKLVGSAVLAATS